MEKSLDNKATQQHFANDEQTPIRHDSPFMAPSGQDVDKSLLTVPTGLKMNADENMEMVEATEKELFGSPSNSPNSPVARPESDSTAPDGPPTDSASKEATGWPDNTEVMNDGLDNANTITLPDRTDFQESELNPATNDGEPDSTTANSQMEIDHPQSGAQSNSVQQLPPDPLAGAAATPHGQMPTPAAPASMLTQLRPSINTRPHIGDLPIVCRLISASVILFRMGSAAEAQKLGQFTIDLAGQQLWDRELPTYLRAPPLPIDSVDSATRLLREAVKYMRSKHRPSSDFLDGMLYAWS